MTTTDLERLCLAHRYLYYVEAMPAIGDREYDFLEKELLVRDDLVTDSPMRRSGSDLRESYSDETVRLAKSIAMPR